MIRVFIWSFRGKSEAWGHAAMEVSNTYISWWPQHPGQVPSGLHRNIYSSHPYRNRTFSQDVIAEGQWPDHIISLEGLNEKAILDWWQSFGLTRDGQIYQGPLQPWTTLKQNCSTVVATGLKKGGGDQYAGWTKSWNLIWTPKEVLQYALSIQQKLKKK